MKRHLQAGIVAVFLALNPMVHAEDTFPVLKVGSEVYSNVTVMTVTATDIYFQHSKGMGNAKLKNLAPELQKRYKFDPTKAAQLEQTRRKGNAEFRTEFTRTAQSQAVEAAARKKAAEEAAKTESQPDVADDDINAKSFLGQRQPDIFVEKWLTQVPGTKNKFVLIDFWATWCGPCRASIPLLNAIQEKYGDRVVVIGLTDEPEATVRAMTSPQIKYFIASDTQGRTSKAVGIRAIPHAILIDPQGIVRYEGHPEKLNTQAGFDELLAKYGLK